MVIEKTEEMLGQLQNSLDRFLRNQNQAPKLSETMLRLGKWLVSVITSVIVVSFLAGQKLSTYKDKIDKTYQIVTECLSKGDIEQLKNHINNDEIHITAKSMKSLVVSREIYDTAILDIRRRLERLENIEDARRSGK